MSETLGKEATSVTITAAELFGESSQETVKAAPETPDAQGDKGKSEAQDTKADASDDQNEDQDQAGDDESKDNDGSEDEQEESEDESKGKKKTGIEKRISKLVKKNQAMKQKLEFYEQQMMAKSQANESAQAQGKAAAEQEPNIDDFDTYEAYQKAMFRHEAKQMLKPELDEIKKTVTKPQADAEAQKLQADFGKKVKAFAKENADYTEAVQNLNGIEVDKSVERAIVDSEHGPALLYELGKNPDLAIDIAEMSVERQLKEIGKLEAKIEARILAKKTPKTTKAPAPPTPVGAKSEGKRTVDDPKLSFMEYMRLRDEQEKQRKTDFL